MIAVHLRPITASNVAECLNLRVRDDQTPFVAATAKSLAEAKVNALLFPLAIYDVAARGYEQPTTRMIGFAMYEISAGVGFIMRLLIDERFQGRGYGKATVNELIRRLHLYPEVEVIGTSHKLENVIAGRLYSDLGFIPWDIEYAKSQSSEVYLILNEDSLR